MSRDHANNLIATTQCHVCLFVCFSASLLLSASLCLHVYTLPVSCMVSKRRGVMNRNNSTMLSSLCTNAVKHRHHHHHHHHRCRHCYPCKWKCVALTLCTCLLALCIVIACLLGTLITCCGLGLCTLRRKKNCTVLFLL